MEKKTSKKNKRNKTSIVFNEASRKEFLTGFRKRKNERRKKAKEQLEKEYKDEIKRAKIKAKEDVIRAKETGPSHQIVPEIKHLLQGSIFFCLKVKGSQFRSSSIIKLTINST